MPNPMMDVQIQMMRMAVSDGRVTISANGAVAAALTRYGCVAAATSAVHRAISWAEASGAPR